MAEGPAGCGQVVGLDISDEMIARARETSRDFENLLFVWGSAEQIPWEENYFDKALSIEAFYYFPDQERVLSELLRVMAPNAEVLFSSIFTATILIPCAGWGSSRCRCTCVPKRNTRPC